MFESFKALQELIAWLAYIAGGIAAAIIFMLWTTALNLLIAVAWWIPLLYIVIKEDYRKITAENLKFWAGKKVSEERKKKNLEDIEKDLKKNKQL